MTIGVLCAIPQELVHLRDALAHPWGEEVAHTRFEKGALDGHEVVLAGAGIGKVNTALVATILADRFRCRTIVFSGVAGGLDPALRIGDVVIADRTVQHDAGVIEDERLQTYQAGHVPFFNPTDRLGYPVDAALLGRVRERLEGFDAAAALAPGRGRGPAAAHHLRHDPLGRPVPALRGDARAAVPRAGRPGDRDGGRGLGPGLRGVRPRLARHKGAVRPRRSRFALRLHGVRRRGRGELGRDPERLLPVL